MVMDQWTRKGWCYATPSWWWCPWIWEGPWTGKRPWWTGFSGRSWCWFGEVPFRSNANKLRRHLSLFICWLRRSALSWFKSLMYCYQYPTLLSAVEHTRETVSDWFRELGHLLFVVPLIWHSTWVNGWLPAVHPCPLFCFVTFLIRFTHGGCGLRTDSHLVTQEKIKWLAAMVKESWAITRASPSTGSKTGSSSMCITR